MTDRIRVPQQGIRMDDIDISEHNWGLEIEDGRVEEIRLGNWTDAGWNWSLKDQDANEALNTYLIRLANSGIKDEFLKKVEEENVDFDIFKKQILENLSKPLANDEVSDDGLWVLSGDNGVWKFDQDDNAYHMSAKEDFFEDIEDVKVEEKIEDEMLNHLNYMNYADWLASYGDNTRNKNIKILKSSDTFEEYFDKITDSDFTFEILEDRVVLGEEAYQNAYFKAEEVLKERGDIPRQIE